MSKHKITRAEILASDVYARERKERRAAITLLKRPRRVSVGPYATFYFENYDTMFQQIHEMLHIEKGGEEQIADELAAYNPLIPQGNELVATLMLEIDDPVRRDRELRRIAHIENFIALEIDGESAKAEAEGDIERTTDDGKTSAVHFIRFHLSPTQIAKFRDPAKRVMLSITHENYGHMAVMSAETRAALAKDLN